MFSYICYVLFQKVVVAGIRMATAGSLQSAEIHFPHSVVFKRMFLRFAVPGDKNGQVFL
jgi:hypothetical protein